MVKVRGLSGRLSPQFHAGAWPQPSAPSMHSRVDVLPVRAELRVGDHPPSRAVRGQVALMGRTLRVLGGQEQTAAQVQAAQAQALAQARCPETLLHLKSSPGHF